MDKRKLFNLTSMSTDVADKAIDFFIRQRKNSDIDYEQNKPIIIFYGGEPLVNYNVLVYITKKLLKLSEKEECLRKIEFSMVTNGLLLNDERIITLKKLGVGIAVSVDGFTEDENGMRVDLDGKCVFSRVLQKIKRAQELDANISLSVTLSEETIKHKEHVLELVKAYNIRSFGFNIMMSSDTFSPSESYNENAAQFIIDEFVELRKLGIYEDRMMRKLEAFTKARVYYADCAATAGGQIVIAPNGQVGICHGCLYNKKYFVTNVEDEFFDCTKNETFREWSQLGAIYKEECLVCPALGICGGGCPLNAMYQRDGNTIHSIDERFCVHAKKTLEFLIQDLYRVVSQRNVNER